MSAHLYLYLYIYIIYIYLDAFSDSPDPRNFEGAAREPAMSIDLDPDHAEPRHALGPSDCVCDSE